MDFLQIVNIFANIFICLGMTLFFLLLYGNEHSIVYKWPLIRHWSLKASLISIIAASAWNAMNVLYKMVVPRHGDILVTVTQIPVGEVILNIGLACLFCWAVYFHKYHFLKIAPPKKTSTVKKKAVKK
jgi:hypothetical protein